MSTIPTARYHQDKSQVAVIGGNKEGKMEYMREASPQNKSAKKILSQNFGKLVNNRTHANNATKIKQHSQSPIEVR